MKKINVVFLLGSLALSQCSKDAVESSCGCNSAFTVKVLTDAKATIHKNDPDLNDKLFSISLDQVEPNAKYFSTLISCDSMIFNDSKFQDGTKIVFTGEVKPICSNPNIKVGSSPVVVKKIEVAIYYSHINYGWNGN